MHESESEVAQSCPTLSNPMDCSLSGSSAHGIFQARVLEWGAIAFSGLKARLTKYKFLVSKIIFLSNLRISFHCHLTPVTVVEEFVVSQMVL